MPAPAPVVALAQILLQPLQVGRARPLRQVGRDGIGRSYGSYATYGPGLTIVAGGGSQSVGGVNMPYASASIIDTRSGGLQITPAAPMSERTMRWMPAESSTCECAKPWCSR